jgi:hypothetical protein
MSINKITYLHSGPVVHDRGKNRIFKDSGHTSRPTSRIKGKQRIKECSYVEPACFNIAIQRTVNDHTSYMIRVRAKFKMDEEISEHWSTSKSERL